MGACESDHHRNGRDGACAGSGRGACAASRARFRFIGIRMNGFAHSQWLDSLALFCRSRGLDGASDGGVLEVRRGPGERRPGTETMGIFYLNVSTISRSAGRRAVVAAAYCSRARLGDEGLGRDVDFSELSDLEHSEILLPSGAPDRWLDRGVLWNEIENVEERENAQLAREIELVLSKELPIGEGMKLARAFLLEQFVERGMIVDFNIHRTQGADGVGRGYVQALFSMREVLGDGFGKKRTDWKETKLLLNWRTRWALLTNKHLIETGRDRMIGAGPSAARGRALEPLLGAGGQDYEAENHELGWRNGERLLAEPGLALEALTRGGGTFTRGDLTEFVKRNSGGDEQYGMALARVESSVDLVRLSDGVLTTRNLIGSVPGAAANGLGFGHEAGTAGHADGGGSGRTLREAVALWEAAGLRVRGVGLTYDLAKKFEKTTAIKSVAVHGLLGRWQKKRELLASNDVLVVNDVGEMSRKQKEWMLKAARAVAAKLVLVEGEEFVEIDGGDIGLDARQLVALSSGERSQGKAKHQRRSLW
jgi:hypothetical protein